MKDHLKSTLKTLIAEKRTEKEKQDKIIEKVEAFKNNIFQ
jgi:hypothetical protein